MAQPPPKQPLRVLLLSQASHTRRAVACIGERAGIAIVQAANWQAEVLPQLSTREHGFDAVLIDCRAAGDDLAVLTAAIRSAAPDLPMVHILDTLPDVGDRALTTLARPIRRSRLIETLFRAVGAPLPTQTEASELGGTVRRSERSLRVLLAEDNTTNQKVAARIVERLGHRLDVVSNGAEAVEAVKSLPYDIVLMDVQMPEMDGLEATRLIRALASDKAKTPIIAMTASVLDGIIARCRAAGMNDYISKPFSVSNLQQCLIRWTTHMKTSGVDQDGHSDAHAAVDRAHLDELVEHLGSDGIADLVADYAAAVPSRVKQLQDAAAGNDLVALSAAAHSFASAAAALGLSELVATARSAEHAALAGDGIAARRHIERVPAAVERAVATLIAAVPRAA